MIFHIHSQIINFNNVTNVFRASTMLIKVFFNESSNQNFIDLTFKDEHLCEAVFCSMKEILKSIDLLNQSLELMISNNNKRIEVIDKLLSELNGGYKNAKEKTNLKNEKKELALKNDSLLLSIQKNNV